MVDEFQDTDPVQWQVIDRAFTGRSTLILIGDPKQAIYAFRGGDIVTYLKAAETAGVQKTLGNELAQRRRTGAIACRRCCGGAAARATRGSSCTTSRRITTAHAWRARRTTTRSGCGSCAGRRSAAAGLRSIPIGDLRTHIPRDLAADIGDLLASGATFDGRPLEARDVAVIVENAQGRARLLSTRCARPASRRCTPATPTSSTPRPPTTGCACWRRSTSRTARAWCAPPRRRCSSARRPRTSSTAATTLTDEVAETLREWAGHARERGVAAIFEAAQLSGMGDRVLSWQGGERQMTDLAHMTQLLQEVAHREHFSLPALRDWLRAQRDERSGATERYRRLDNDAAAVQIMTVWVSQGSAVPDRVPAVRVQPQCPEPRAGAVPRRRRAVPAHRRQGQPRLQRRRRGWARAEDASDDSRLTYVAMTRAQSQVVAWWAPSHDEPNGGLSRLLRGRRPGEADGAGSLLRRTRSPTTTRWRASGSGRRRAVR